MIQSLDLQAVYIHAVFTEKYYSFTCLVPPLQYSPPMQKFPFQLVYSIMHLFEVQGSCSDAPFFAESLSEFSLTRWLAAHGHFTVTNQWNLWFVVDYIYFPLARFYLNLEKFSLILNCIHRSRDPIFQPWHVLLVWSEPSDSKNRMQAGTVIPSLLGFSWYPHFTPPLYL